MLRRALIFIFALFIGVAGAANGPVANIEWVHGAIENIWGIEIPYNSELKNPLYASNMEYLLTAVDRANYVINGFESSQFRKNKTYATKLAANIETAEAAINTLIREEVLVFRTLRTTTNFSIKIAAKGNFTIDWGDGNVQEINQTTTTQTTYSHNYDKAGVYYIRPRGKATEYNADGFVPSIKIGTPAALATINGSLGAVFSTLSNGSQPSFYGTFANCSNLRGKIPADLFEGVRGQADKWYMFALLFDGCTKLEGPIPEKLFATITGTPVQGMFESTFRNCSSLKGSIPEKLFQSVAGDMSNYMFNMTFQGCSGLTGSIPGDLFKTITGQPGVAGFYKLFKGCSGLRGGIPGTLFQNLNGESQESTFAETFSNMSIGGKIPADLFKGVTGRPGPGAFWATFMGTNFTAPIPEDLFASMSGAPRENCFRQTFHQSRGTCNNIPAGLFRTIQGAPAPYMFSNTFVDCGVNRIPEGFFSGIKGPPAEGMFERSFHWNNVGALPAGLFAGISGAPAPYMFKNTFDSSWGITKIGVPLFGDLRGPAANQMFYGMFNGSSAIKGPSAQMQIVNEDGSTENHFIYEFWDMTSNQVTYNSSASGMDDYECIPTTWGGGGTKKWPECVTDWPFAVKSTDMDAGSVFTLSIGAAGTFYIDWGDGNFDRIDKSDALATSYSHTYKTAGSYDIKFSGTATKYAEYTDETLAAPAVSAISFADNSYVAGVSGNLARIFSTLADGSNPCFFMLFSGCENLTGDIPENLFSGLTGTAAVGQFAGVFQNCTGLTEIPENLFVGVTKPSGGMFVGTFIGCTGLTEIPENMFASFEMGKILPRGMFAYTFQDCSELRGPSVMLNGKYLYDLYSDVSDVFDSMYGGATGLSDYQCIPRSWGGGNSGNNPACVADWPLTMTVSGNRFAMMFGFEGQAYVDWGDGTVENFDGLSVASHTYSTSGTYDVRIAARPTGYYGSDYPVFKVTTPYMLRGVQGSLGKVFPTLADGSNPAFIETFQDAIYLTSLPDTLFDGLTGEASPYMFFGTFWGCEGLTEIPTYLFAGVTVPSDSMFVSTFENCVGLSRIPENLLSHLELGPNLPEYMFEYMFANCTELRGESVKINGMYLYDEYPDVPGVFSGMYQGCRGLTDFADIPESWK